MSERNEDRAISYRTPSARKQFIPLHCSTLIRPTFSFYLSDPTPCPPSPPHLLFALSFPLDRNLLISLSLCSPVPRVQYIYTCVCVCTEFESKRDISIKKKGNSARKRDRFSIEIRKDRKVPLVIFRWISMASFNRASF